MIDKLTKVKDMVLFELEHRPETRSSDNQLITAVLSDYYGVEWYDTFFGVMARSDIPSFETIRRCRARVQAEREDLKAEKTVIGFREDNQQAFFTFFGGGDYE